MLRLSTLSGEGTHSRGLGKIKLNLFVVPLLHDTSDQYRCSVNTLTNKQSRALTGPTDLYLIIPFSRLSLASARSA